MKIIDSHVHFWNPATLHYDWHAEAPPIAHTHLPTDYTAAVEDLDVQGLVFVEADCRPAQRLAEVEWIASLAEHDPRIQGIVASAAMEFGADGVQDHLQALAKQPLVKGVRRLIQAEPLGFSTQAKFVEAIQSLPNYALSFDLCIKHPQLPDILSLVDACPDTSFILDHIGKPDIANELIDPWRDHMQQLSERPNVIGCKLSGLITEAQWDTWTPETLRPYVEHVVHCFGVERVLYGSDWPVSVLAGGYQRWWQAFSAIVLDSLTPAEQTLVAHDNAARIYHLHA